MKRQVGCSMSRSDFLLQAELAKLESVATNQDPDNLVPGSEVSSNAEKVPILGHIKVASILGSMSWNPVKTHYFFDKTLFLTVKNVFKGSNNGFCILFGNICESTLIKPISRFGSDSVIIVNHQKYYP